MTSLDISLIGTNPLVLGLSLVALSGASRIRWIINCRGRSNRWSRLGNTAGALWLLLTVWFVELSVAAQVPGIISYQGKLAVNGTPFNGTAQFKFALVSADGGTTFWSYNKTGNGGTEPANPPISLGVTGGVFSVNLGDLTVSNMTQSIPASIFTNGSVCLRIWVNDGTNGSELLTPDQRITAVGYAMTAANVLGPVASAINFTGPLAGDVTGTQGATVVGTVGGQTAAAVGAGVTLANTATSANLPNTLVKRDSQGNFVAGSVAGAFVGDGSSLTNLNPGSLTGPVANAAGFTGLLAGDVSGTQRATVVGTVGGQMAAAVGTAVTLANTATSINIPNTLVKRDAQGNFVAGSVAGAFVGDGSSLTNLNPGSLTGPVASANRFTGPLAGDVTGIQGATVVSTVGGQTAAAVAAGAALANGATSANLPNTLVKRDSQGKFVAGSVAGAFVGDGSSLTNLNPGSLTGTVASATSFTGPLAGDVTGTQGATVVSAVGGQTAAAVATGATLAGGATSANLPNTLVKRDSQGKFVAGSVAGAFVGDGSSLTNLNAANLTGSLPAAVLQAAAPSGSAMISMLAQDPTLLAGGYQLVMGIPAPAWVNGSTTGAPSARSGQGAVWDGQELIVWGGNISPSGFAPVNSGGMYRPDLDQWQALTPVSVPAPRTAHTAVWTGSQMIVWGGNGTNGYLNTGGRFQPSNQPWSATTINNAPAGRSGHIAVWTGNQMIVWGGQNENGVLGDGALYDPLGDQWTTLSLPNAPAARAGAAAVWAGDRLLLWGGVNEQGSLGTGAQLLFNTSGLPVAWMATSANGAPGGRNLHSVVWTGQKMLVWGGYSGGTYLGDGAAYDPVADSWSPLSLANAPSARHGHSAVWTGQEMLIFGGETTSGTCANGAAYNPTTDSWRTLTTAGAPLARSGAAAAWSGTQFLVFAGLSGGQPLAALQLLNPQPPWYLYRKL